MKPWRRSQGQYPCPNCGATVVVRESELLGGFPLTLALYPLIILVFLALGVFAERYHIASSAVVWGVSAIVAFLLARPIIARLTSSTCTQCKSISSLKELRRHARTQPVVQADRP